MEKVSRYNIIEKFLQKPPLPHAWVNKQPDKSINQKRLESRGNESPRVWDLHIYHCTQKQLLFLHNQSAVIPPESSGWNCKFSGKVRGSKKRQLCTLHCFRNSLFRWRLASRRPCLRKVKAPVPPHGNDDACMPAIEIINRVQASAMIKSMHCFVSDTFSFGF